VEPDDHDGRDDGSETSADGMAPRVAVSEGSVPAGLSRGRLLQVNALIGLATLLLVLGIFATWANRLLFSPDNWSNTSTELLQNANVRSTTANYLVDQLYTNVNVAGVLKSQLPPALAPLAAPAAGALRNAAVQGTELALTRPRVQRLWAQANRAASQSFISIVNGGTDRVGVNHGAVTLNLGAILENVASRLGLPAGLSAKLPPNAANLTVFRSDQLRYVQVGGDAIRGLALWLTILVPVLYGLALLLARGHRRRTLMLIGFTGIFAGALVLLARSILENQIAGALTNDASLRTTIRAVYVISSSILADVAGAVILGGAVLVIAAWFGGPARIARTAREGIAPFLRDHPVESFAITLGVMVLIFVWDPISATGKPAGIIVFTLLALLGTETLIRQTIREFPDARSGAARHALAARWSSRRERRPGDGAASGQAASTTAEQLRQLAELRDNGAITRDEYQTAKTRVLDN
jgi:hypothetical protein